MSEAEKAALAQAIAAQAQREALSDSQRVVINNPDKYGAPIGIDDEGNLFSTKSSKPLRLESGEDVE